MPLLHVNFYASLRKISTIKEVDFELADGTTVNQLLQAVIKRYPPMQEKLLDENGTLGLHAHIIINGRNSPLLAEGMDTIVTGDDKIDVFPIGHF